MINNGHQWWRINPKLKPINDKLTSITELCLVDISIISWHLSLTETPAKLAGGSSSLYLFMDWSLTTRPSNHTQSGNGCWSLVALFPVQLQQFYQVFVKFSSYQSCIISQLIIYYTHIFIIIIFKVHLAVYQRQLILTWVNSLLVESCELRSINIHKYSRSSPPGVSATSESSAQFIRKYSANFNGLY